MTPWKRWLRGLGAVVGAAIGLLVAAGAAFVGQCGAFGGTCPRPRPPFWTDDVFGGLVLGLGLAVFSVALGVRPDRYGFLTAVGVFLVLALPIAYAIAGAAHQGWL